MAPAPSRAGAAPWGPWLVPASHPPLLSCAICLEVKQNILPLCKGPSFLNFFSPFLLKKENRLLGCKRLLSSEILQGVQTASVLHWPLAEGSFLGGFALVRCPLPHTCGLSGPRRPLRPGSRGHSVVGPCASHAQISESHALPRPRSPPLASGICGAAWSRSAPWALAQLLLTAHALPARPTRRL